MLGLCRLLQRREHRQHGRPRRPGERPAQEGRRFAEVAAGDLRVEAEQGELGRIEGLAAAAREAGEGEEQPAPLHFLAEILARPMSAVLWSSAVVATV